MKLKKVLIAFSLLLLLSVVLLWFAWQRVSSSGMPMRDGVASLSGLSSSVTVRWDRWAVPHIEASSARDAAAALGWLHANDRMTQLELGRRAASGRVSELVGRAAVGLDREARVLRLRSTAEGLWNHASPLTREMLEGYADGVNAWLQARGKDLPPALKLLRVQPEPWTTVDSLCFGLLMAKDLSFWQGRPEETRFGWLLAFGPETVAQLLEEPELEIPEGLEPFLDKVRRQREEAAPAAAAADLLPPPFLSRGREPAALGSNGWVIGASRTAGGAPLVVNDPHLGLALPSTWYQVQIRSPEYEASGMSFPGLPVVVIGRGESLAWAFTNTMLDDHDVYFEELDESGTKVRRGDSWSPITTRTEEILIKGGDIEEVEVRTTDRGTLLRSSEHWGLPERTLAWTAYEPSDSVGALLKLAQAETLEEGLVAIESFAAPAQNLMVADRDGGIMAVTLGRVPQRRKGDGRMPLPGWNLEYGWDGLRPADTNPLILRPEDDLVVTANNDYLPEDYPLPFTADFVGAYRAERIRDLIEARGGWTAKDQESVQADVVSLYAREIVAASDGVPGLEGDAAKAWETLKTWDGSMAPRGTAALFDLFHEELQKRTFLDEEQKYRLLGLRGRNPLVRALQGDLPQSFFDDLATDAVENRNEIVRASLEAAWSTGTQRWGGEVDSWPYEEIHLLYLNHPAGSVPLVGDFFNRGPFSVTGSSTSVNAFGGVWTGQERQVGFGPSMRWVVDFADPNGGLAMIPGGQSGHPKDPHYDDQLPLFLKGQLREAPWSPAAIEQATVGTLELRPTP